MIQEKKKKLKAIEDTQKEIKAINEKLVVNNITIQELKKLIIQKKSDLSVAKTILKSNTTKFDMKDNIFEKENSKSESKDDYTLSAIQKMDSEGGKVFDDLRKDSFSYYAYNNLYYNSSGGNLVLNLKNKANLVHMNYPCLEDEISLSNKEKDEVDKHKKKVDKFRIMLSALKNKKIAEVAYFFFNTICDRFYIIPTVSSDEAKVMHLFYERHFKEISVMTGVISQMLNYLSFIFNIPLRYPLLVNGSKSYVVKNKREFLILSYSYRGENRAAQFEVALSALHTNIYEVVKYLKYGSFQKSSNIFKDFIKFYEYCMEVILRNKQIDDGEDVW